MLRTTASQGLRQLLDAIDAYEGFSRLCHDAFQDCLYEMTLQGGKKTSLAVIAALPSVKRAGQRVPARFGEVMERLEPVGEAVRFGEAFSGLAERGGNGEWTERLIEHHLKTQRQKPPNGKNPWFERFDDGSLIVRPDYRIDEPGTGDARYLYLIKP